MEEVEFEAETLCQTLAFNLELVLKWFNSPQSCSSFHSLRFVSSDGIVRRNFFANRSRFLPLDVVRVRSQLQFQSQSQSKFQLQVQLLNSNVSTI